MIEGSDLSSQAGEDANPLLFRRLAKAELLDIVSLEPFEPAFLEKRAALARFELSGATILVIANPDDAATIEAMEFAIGARFDEIVVSSAADIRERIEELRADTELNAEVPPALPEESDDWDPSDAPVIRLVDRLIASAITRRASDIHIEPMERHLSIRYRVDGRLSEAERLAVSLAEPVASRIKVVAALDIAETRLPQDGRMRVFARGREVDIRVGISPIAHGESVVLRILGKSHVPLDLEALGLPAPALAQLGDALARPHGIVLLTGPTGSGKTTTLYAALNRLRGPEVKILTVEDPVEVEIEGVNQVQVRPEIDLTFAATLRAFLRQDPDILMIGEIRDGETAEIAMRAALTGHLVLSTLHTNTAAGAFTRLADLGVAPFLTASSVIATVAQRLVRTLCGECAVAHPIEPDEVALFGAYGVVAPAEVREPCGCAHCDDSGYRGRAPLIEVIAIDGARQQLIRDGAVDAIAAMQPPAETLIGHGLALVAEGRTSLAEIRRTITF